MSHLLLTLASIYGQLSLLAFGGGNVVLPEMQRQVVDVNGWMTAQHFTALFALAQAAPGPNLMIATLIGWQVAGPFGALVATGAIVGPSSVVTVLTVSVWERFRHAAWRRIVQAGLVPITIGLVCSTGALIAWSADQDVFLSAITLAVAAFVLRTKLHPLWLLAGGAALGALGA